MPYCITHNDLDGVGCAVLMEKIFPEVKTFCIDYDEIDNILPAILAKAPDTKIFITDISLNQKQLELCDAHGGVQHIDHHSSNKELSDKYQWSMTDIGHCATYHLFKMFSQYAILGDYRELVELIDDYDTWGHNTQPSEEAKDLNRLLKMTGIAAFVTRFKYNASLILSDAESALIDADKRLEDEYLMEALDRVQATVDKNGDVLLMIAAEQYTSSLGNYLLSQVEESEYIIIFDILRNKASLRSKGKVDVGELAKSCGGGGHRRAAGFQINFNPEALIGE